MNNYHKKIMSMENNDSVTVRVEKLEELPNASRPNNIKVGFVKEGKFVGEPVVGTPFYIDRIWRTSRVTEIVSKNTFKTLNSIYRWTILDNDKKENSEPSLSFRQVVEEKGYFSDLEKWEKSFWCNECGEMDHKNFIYERTIANGEEWQCKTCKNKIMVDFHPNQDEY